MITANNYFDEVKPIVGKLPASVKEAHNLVVAMKKDGIDDPFHTGDSDIDSMGELLLKKANEILSSSSTKTEKPKAEVKPKVQPKPKTAKKAPAKKAAKKASVKKTVYGKPAKTKAKKGAKHISKKSARKATAKKIKQVVKNVRKADAAKPAITKKIYSKELELVKAFIAIKGKEISIASIHTKRNAVYNALKNEKVNQHQAILENILRRYDKVLKAIKDDVTHIKGNIETGFYNTCKNLVTNAKIKVRTDFLAGIPTSNTIEMNLTEYLAQENPAKNVIVNLDRNDVAIWGNGNINIVNKDFVKRFGRNFVYRFKNDDNILYALVNDKWKPSVFKLIDNEKPAKK